MIIFHNNRCSKSREALELLQDNKCEIEIRDYLHLPPSKKEITEILDMLHCKAFDIVRQNEPLFIEKYRDKKITNARWIDILSKNPILIERPIIIDGEKAIVGRPVKLVIDLIKTNRKKK